MRSTQQNAERVEVGAVIGGRETGGTNGQAATFGGSCVYRMTEKLGLAHKHKTRTNGLWYEHVQQTPYLRPKQQQPWSSSSSSSLACICLAARVSGAGQQPQDIRLASTLVWDGRLLATSAREDGLAMIGVMGGSAARSCST